jgi:hypothetical protein
VFSYSLAKLVETIGHDNGSRGEVHARSEAAGWQIALVLDWLVAAHRRHVLRHLDGERIGLMWHGLVALFELECVCHVGGEAPGESEGCAEIT